MVIEITSPYELCDQFRKFNRDYYSIEGYEFILNCFDEDRKLDVIEICCSFTEYGNNAGCSFDDFISDYGYITRDMVLEPDFNTVVNAFLTELSIPIYRLRNGNVMIIE